jgi:hypothetical protein
MPTIAKGKMRRLMEAAQKDKTPMRFVEEFCEAIGKREIQVDSFRQLYEELIPHGRELVDSWNPRNEGGQISLHTVLENAGSVVAAAFSRVNGQIAYTTTMDGYQQEDFVFKNMIPVQSTPYDGEKIPGISGLGDKGQVIAEGQPYPYAGVNEDFIETPSTTKRGIITAVTREAVYFDRTSQLLENLRQVGEVIGLGHEKEAIDCVIDENRTGHRYNRLGRGAVATYGDNSGNHDWDNLQASNALADWTDIDNAEQLLYSILDPNTGEPIVLTGNMRLICTANPAGNQRRAREPRLRDDCQPSCYPFANAARHRFRGRDQPPVGPASGNRYRLVLRRSNQGVQVHGELAAGRGAGTRQQPRRIHPRHCDAVQGIPPRCIRDDRTSRDGEMHSLTL